MTFSVVTVWYVCVSGCTVCVCGGGCVCGYVGIWDVCVIRGVACACVLVVSSFKVPFLPSPLLFLLLLITVFGVLGEFVSFCWLT